MASRFTSTLIHALLAAAALVALSCVRAVALEAHFYPDFVQIQAVQPRPDGGFVVVGFLRSPQGRSGFQVIGPDGAPIGEAVAFPLPDTDHSEVWVSSLLALPDGDFVAAGWADSVNGKPDGWVIRFHPDRTVVWASLIGEDDRDERFYSVKRLSSGDLILTGRQQVSMDLKTPSRGLAVLLADDGKVIEQKNSPGSCPNANRCGFQDVAELPDGSLVFAGWLTKADNTDDVWLFKQSPDGTRTKSITFGEAANDVAFAIAASGNGIVVGGTQRKRPDSPIGFVAVLDSELARRNVVALDRWIPGSSQVRALLEIPSTGQVILTGETARTVKDDTAGFAGTAVMPALAVAFDDPAPGAGISFFRGVAVDSLGTIALAGGSQEGRGKPQRGFIALRKAPALCASNSNRVDEISAALAGGSLARLQACVTAERPARFKLGGGAKDRVVAVWPQVGDIDAVLTAGGATLDASLNEKQRPELIVLPTTGSNLELTVSTTTPFASFTVAALNIEKSKSAQAGPNEEDKRPEADDSTPPDDSETVQGDADQMTDRRLTALAFRLLGYDLLGALDRTDVKPEFVDGRAIMAFQAAEGFPLTGTLSDEQRDLLLLRAARQLDREARPIAERARGIAGRSEPVKGSGGSDVLASMAGQVEGGRFAGVGEFTFGGNFAGNWLDSNPGPGGNAPQRPDIGVLQLPGNCSISLRTLRLQPGSYSLYEIMQASLGAVRVNNQVVYAGPLKARAQNDARAVCRAEAPQD